MNPATTLLVAAALPLGASSCSWGRHLHPQTHFPLVTAAAASSSSSLLQPSAVVVHPSVVEPPVATISSWRRVLSSAPPRFVAVAARLCPRRICRSRIRPPHRRPVAAWPPSPAHRLRPSSRCRGRGSSCPSQQQPLPAACRGPARCRPSAPAVAASSRRPSSAAPRLRPVVAFLSSACCGSRRDAAARALCGRDWSSRGLLIFGSFKSRPAVSSPSSCRPSSQRSPLLVHLHLPLVSSRFLCFLCSAILKSKSNFVAP